MKDNFDELNKALNTASDIVKSEPEEMKIVIDGAYYVYAQSKAGELEHEH